MNIEEARQQARDENTAPEILIELSKSEDSQTRQYVAGNPNTPVGILEKLGDEFPDEITANPIFDLLFLENPESKFIWLSLARSSTTSAEKLNQLANHQDRNIRVAVAKNKNITLNILEKFVTKEYQDENILAAIAKNPNTSAYILDKMFENNLRYFPFELVLKNSKTLDITLEKIVIDRSLYCSCTYDLVRQGVAEHPKITPEILDKLKDDQNTNIRKKVAENLNMSLVIMEYLAKDSIASVRQALVKNVKTPATILDKLKSDRSKYVRQAVAENPNTSLDTLRELLNDKEPKIAMIAKNK